MSRSTFPNRYPGGPGKHRKPSRRLRAAWRIRGSVLSGVASTVAVSGATASVSAEENPNESTAELPVLDGVLSGTAASAAESTRSYADETAMRQARDEAEQDAIDRAAHQAAERRERQERQERKRREAAEQAETQSRASTVVDYVRAQLGDSYTLGATGPDTWDCSSLVQAAYASAGVSLPRTAAEQSVSGAQISLDDIQPGDILYWGSAGSAYHVAIYTGDGTFIGAQNSGSGVVEHTLDWDPPTGAVRVS